MACRPRTHGTAECEATAEAINKEPVDPTGVNWRHYDGASDFGNEAWTNETSRTQVNVRQSVQRVVEELEDGS